jgi:hypothetical protein
MKKWVVLLMLLSIFSCQKEEFLVEPQPVITYIFEEFETVVSNGQELNFKLSSADNYSLRVYNTLNNNLITKENFNGTVGTNTKKIFTSTLTSGKYKLVLYKGSEILETTFIIVE